MRYSAHTPTLSATKRRGHVLPAVRGNEPRPGPDPDDTIEVVITWGPLTIEAEGAPVGVYAAWGPIGITAEGDVIGVNALWGPLTITAEGTASDPPPDPGDGVFVDDIEIPDPDTQLGVTAGGQPYYDLAGVTGPDHATLTVTADGIFLERDGP